MIIAKKTLVSLAVALLLPFMVHGLLPKRSVWRPMTIRKGQLNSVTGHYQGPGTKSMTQRLGELISHLDAGHNVQMSDERIALWRTNLGHARTPQQKLQSISRIAEELLNAGRSEEALHEFQKAEVAARVSLPTYLSEQMLFTLHKQEAMCWLRLGEQQNCCANNNADSCLLPIKGRGIHTLPTGSRQGIRLLEQLLAVAPNDMGMRWSLNIAYMTLGEYPAGVPSRWLIPVSAFKSEASFARFSNVASDVGLDLNGMSGSCLMEDFDGDGRLDIMVCRSGLRSQLQLFHNNGNGTFTERTAQAGLTGEVGGINLIQADYDNDGFADVFILRGNGLPTSLLHNNGDGTFEDVTEAAGLLSVEPGCGAAWLDFDGDGFLDLFVANQTVYGEAHPHPCQLYHNNGDGTFRECAREYGLDKRGDFRGVVSVDTDLDGRPDLFLVGTGGTSMLLHNDGPGSFLGWMQPKWKFSDITARAGLQIPQHCTTCCWLDYDNDGWPDLFVPGGTNRGAGDVGRDLMGASGAGEPAQLFHNNHNGTFTDVSAAMHLNKVMMGQSASFGDLDNDGWLDLYVGTGGPGLGDLVPKRMFHSVEGRFFQEVTTAGNFGHLQKGGGIAWGDLTNNGMQSIYEVMGGVYPGDVAHNVLYRNPGSSNHWVTIVLEGLQSNRSAIGARIHLIVDTPTGKRNIYRTVGTSGSWSGSPLRQEIGLGHAGAIESLTIAWPATGKTQRLYGLKMDHRYKIPEGASKPLPELQ